MGRLEVLQNALGRAGRWSRDASRRAAWWSSTPAGLAWLFVAGLGIRLWLARGGGFPFDTGTFSAWADRLATGGLGRFYPRDPKDYFVDYPPGYMYVLFVVGKVSRLLAGGPPSPFLLKVPAVLADLALAGIAVVLASRLTPHALAVRFPWRGVVAAAILLNPAVFFVSSVWGQVDAVLAVLVLGGFALLGTGERTVRRQAAGLALLSLALATKPQAAFVLPVAVVLLLWQHVRGAAAEGRSVVGGVGRVAGLGLFALGFGLAVVAPFGLSLPGWVRFYTRAAGTYQYTSVWAFNLWGAVGFWRPDVGKPDAVRLVGVPALAVGLAAFSVGAVALLVRAWRALQRGELEGRVAVFGAVGMTCLGFAVLTRIHERYLFLALACLAPLLAYAALRRAFVLLSVLYLTNVYFAWVWGIEYVKRKTFKVDWLYTLVYGMINDSAQKKLISLATAAVCLVLAWRGWRWLEARSGVEGPRPAPPARLVPEPFAPAGPEGEPAGAPLAPPRPPRWSLRLHPVGRRGAALALLVFLVAAASRFAGLGSPPGMYFDEVYHARTGGEYLQGKEVYEWTHPPLAKELIALSIRWLSGFGVRERRPLPEGLRGGLFASDGATVVWAGPSGGRGRVLTASLAPGCALRPSGQLASVSVAPEAVAASAGGAVVAGRGPLGPALARVEGGREVWSAILPAPPRAVAALDRTAFAVVEPDRLVLVPEQGAPRVLADGAFGLWAVREDGVVWVSFPAAGQAVAYGPDGTARVTVQLRGQPGAIVASAEADRVLVADRSSPRIESVDTESRTRTDELGGPAPDRFGTVSETGLVWAVRGREGRVIEPRGLSVIGRVQLPAPPAALLDGGSTGRLVAVTDRELVCLGGRPAFAWRFGSAATGSLAAALVFLLGLRLFGNVAAAALASLFLVVDGLAFVLARIAMNDSYTTAFLLAAWFAVLSSLYRWGAGGEDRRSRPAALAWLGLGGLAAGLATSSKWVGLYGLAGILLLLAFDARRRGRDGIAGLAGHPVASAAVVAVALLGLPLAVYVASYIPYFRLGHSLGELVQLQRGMYAYHAHLTATHPYGSPWYGWPFGYKAVWLYLGRHGAEQAEIWTVANPIVFLGGLVGLAALGARAWRQRSGALGVVVLAALAQYLPWIPVRRVTFLYHYLPVVPFLALGLAWWLVVGRQGAKRQRAEVVAVAAAALLVFVFTLPLLDGWFVSPGYLSAVKAWLSWMF